MFARAGRKRERCFSSWALPLHSGHLSSKWFSGCGYRQGGWTSRVSVRTLTWCNRDAYSCVESVALLCIIEYRRYEKIVSVKCNNLILVQVYSDWIVNQRVNA